MARCIMGKGKRKALIMKSGKRNKSIKLSTIAARYNSSKTDIDRLVCLNTMEKILVKNLQEAQQLKKKIETREKYRRYRLTRA